MKRRELVERLEAQGCVLIRHGGKHDWYQNPRTRMAQPVPRHSGCEPSRRSARVRFTLKAVNEKPRIGRREAQAQVLALFPAERYALAHRLGEEDVQRHAVAHGLSIEEARRRLSAASAAGRRPSCAQALE